MDTKSLERTPALAAVLLAVLTVAACAIRLGGDEAPTNMAAGSAPDPLTAKLRECRSVTDLQKDALAECRRLWAGQRRRFLGQKAPTPPDRADSQSGPSVFVAPKDESRLPSGYPSTPQIGKE
ncbi:MAG: putative entry exclusion protein TrbK-alt [Bradyrhizobium sp.]|nr:putative entry exclusion protein TrbK-alt [Bradyrhizobium sp.]